MVACRVALHGYLEGSGEWMSVWGVHGYLTLRVAVHGYIESSNA